MSWKNRYRNGMGSMVLLGLYGTAIAEALWGILLMGIGLIGYYIEMRSRWRWGGGL